MVEPINIVVEEQKLAQNDEKSEWLRKTQVFEPTDRVPVIINTNQWTALTARNRTTADYLREQILNIKWRLEHI